MPIDLDTIVKAEKEERETKLHPKLSKLQKKRITQSLTHWVVVDKNGKMHGSLFKNIDKATDYLERNLFELENVAPLRLQKLTCHPSIPCECGEVSKFVKYHGHNIKYSCKNKHEIVISEYD